jgi:NADPH:quinone reductase-like Zn-dependent oxidoreductase
MQSGQMRAVIDRSCPLSDAGAAIAYAEEGHVRGKVIITPD